MIAAAFWRWARQLEERKGFLTAKILRQAQDDKGTERAKVFAKEGLSFCLLVICNGDAKLAGMPAETPA
ncbi:hypothetical protein GCM10023184_32840 [Flaviaesturariibacter amylovorans]|uniref:Uncharacterized protein n=1 Tax=Flaviaesturariibacter amylovorans TaxID=1084520 RepID=A0ABP8HBS0_9BACT